MIVRVEVENVAAQGTDNVAEAKSGLHRRLNARHVRVSYSRNKALNIC